MPFHRIVPITPEVLANVRVKHEELHCAHAEQFGPVEECKEENCAEAKLVLDYLGERISRRQSTRQRDLEIVRARNRAGVLMVGRDELLQRLRADVLSHSGYEITRAETDDEVLQWLDEQNFSAIVIGESIPERQRNILAGKVKQRDPSLPIVMLFSNPWERDGLASRFVTGVDGTDAVLKALKEVLRDSGHPTGNV